MIIATNVGCVAFSPLTEEQEPARPTLTKEILEEAIAHARSTLRRRGCINVTEDEEQTRIGAFQLPAEVVVDRKRKVLYRTDPAGSFSLFHSKRKAETVFQVPFALVEGAIEQVFKSHHIAPTEGGYDAAYQKHLSRATAKALNTAYRSPMRDLIRQFYGAVWCRLDSRILQATIRTAGFSADSLDYSLFWQNSEEAVETFTIAPGLMPLWLYVAESRLIERDGHDGFRRTSLSRHKVERKLDRLDCRMPPIVPDMRALLPVSPRGWRYLCGLNPMWTRTLLKQYVQRSMVETLKEISYMLEILAEAETIPSYSTFRAFIAHAEDLVKTPHLVALARAAFAQSRLERRKLRFVGNELSSMMEWFKESKPQLDANQLKRKWPWFQRQREEWRARELARKRAATQYKEWTSLVERFTHGDYELLALTNSHDLCEEAHSMHHCVDQYAERCARGTHRLFSLRLKRTNERIATAELVNLGYRPGTSEWLGHHWTRSQVKGKYNQAGNIPQAALKAVEALKVRYQELAIETNSQPPDADDDEQDEIFF